MMSFEKDILTFTFPFNVLIGHQEIMTLTLTLNVIGQNCSHMIKLFAYLINSECLLHNSHHGLWLAKYNQGLFTCIN